MRAPYPGIRRATLLIALDNGGINRDRCEKQQGRDLDRFLQRQPHDILPAIDRWLASLPTDDLETVCAGEHGEAQMLLATAPPFTESLLNDYFDEVC